MDTIKKIKTSESSIPRLEEIKNKIFAPGENQKVWQRITSFLVGSEMGSTDFTKFAKFCGNFFCAEPEPGGASTVDSGKDNYKTMYNWILVNKKYYKIFQPFMRNLKRFYDTMKKRYEVFFGEIYMNIKIGTMIYPNGQVYEGKFKDGQKHGKGKESYPWGRVYDGDFENGSASGKGRLSYKSGRVYVGEFKHGLENGKGTLTLADKSVYVGEFKHGKRDGKGKYTFASGPVYDGEWKDNKMHGNGTYTYAEGEAYDGDWEDGNKHGKGKYTFASGPVYDGEWKDDKKHGKGTYTLPSGHVYVGEWFDDKRILLDRYKCFKGWENRKFGWINTMEKVQ